TKRRKDAIVIDVGSAVTVDLVKNRSFKGGVILAGPALSLLALAQNTEKLPLLEYRLPTVGLIGRFDSTEHSMRMGAWLGTLGGIRAAVTLFEKSAGRSITKIITGGGADTVAASLPKGWRREPHLVMKGLYRIWEMNHVV
ncbi:MAG: type III pantothenate kinase, partial [Candidatus Latescibacterota bacterium]